MYTSCGTLDWAEFMYSPLIVVGMSVWPEIFGILYSTFLDCSSNSVAKPPLSVVLVFIFTDIVSLLLMFGKLTAADVAS